MHENVTPDVLPAGLTPPSSGAVTLIEVADRANKATPTGQPPHNPSPTSGSGEFGGDQAIEQQPGMPEPVPLGANPAL